MREGGGEQRHALDVEDGVGFGVTLRQQRARGPGRQRRSGHRQQHLPGGVPGEGGRGNLAIAGCRDGEASVPAGGDVVGMALTTAGLCDEVGVRELEAAEVAGQSYTRQQRGGAGAAPHAQRNLVMDRQVQRNDGSPGTVQHIGVGIHDEVVLEHSAEFGVATRSGDRKGRSGVGLDGEVHGDSETHSIKAGAEVGGGRGQRQAQAAGMLAGAHAGCGAPAVTLLRASMTRSTLSASGSSTTGWRRICACWASSAALAPSISCSLSSSPR